MMIPGIMAQRRATGGDPPFALRVLVAGVVEAQASLYNADTGEDLSAQIATKPPSSARAVAVNPPRTIAAFGSTGSPYLTLYNTADWSLITPPTQPGAIYSVAFSPDGTKLAVGSSVAPRLRLYNTADWSAIAIAEPPSPGTTNAVAFSPDSSVLVAVGTSTYLAVYNANDGSKIAQPAGVAGSGLSAAYTKGGAVLAVGHANAPYLTLFDSSTWASISLAAPPAYNVTGLASSPDGTLLAAASNYTPYVYTWNTADWSKRAAPAVIPPNTGHSAAFSHDGSKIAIGHYSGTSAAPVAMIYDAATMAAQQAMPVQFSSRYGYGVAFL